MNHKGHLHKLARGGKVALIAMIALHVLGGLAAVAGISSLGAHRHSHMLWVALGMLLLAVVWFAWRRHSRNK